MNYEELYGQIRKKKSFLCVGLDTDCRLLPEHIKGEEFPMFAFNKAIVDSTAEYAVAYKPNLAFYEAEGASGLAQLEMTVNYIRSNYPGMFLIADAKRGDIGNTARMYAKAFFETMDFDAVTPGVRYPMTFAIDDDVYNVYFILLGRETRKIRGLGTVKTIKFAAKLLAGEVFTGEEDMLIWVTDDDNRIPVCFEAPILVGTASGRLAGYSGLKHPFTALVKK